MTQGQIYVAQMRAHFAIVTDPVLCRAVLARRSVERGRQHYFINAWDKPRENAAAHSRWHEENAK